MRIVLNTEVGDADLFIRLQSNSDVINRENWSLPDRREYDFKSEQTLSQDSVIVELATIAQCLEKSKAAEIYQKYKKGEAAECAIIVGVFGRES